MLFGEDAVEQGGLARSEKPVRIVTGMRDSRATCLSDRLSATACLTKQS